MTQEIFGTILTFIPSKYRTKILKSSKLLPKIELLFQFYDLGDEETCSAFKDEHFKLLIKNDNLNRQELFRCVVNRNLIKYVKILLADKRKNKLVDPSAKNNKAIRLASQKGYLEVVKELLKDKRVNPSAYGNEAIIFASLVGYSGVVKELLKDKRVDPSADDNYAITASSNNGHPEVVKELLKDERVDPSVNDNYAIRWASRNGHLEVVKELLKHQKIKYPKIPDLKILSIILKTIKTKQ